MNKNIVGETPSNWAEREFTQGLENLEFISPVINLATLNQGDILASTSGNIRLVIDIETDSKASDLSTVSFLSLLRDGNLSLESAPLNKISTAKLSAMIRRRSGNPLIRFSSLVKNLKFEINILNNISTFFCLDHLGSHLKSKFSELKGTGIAQDHIIFEASPDTGSLKTILDESSSSRTNSIEVSVLFNLLELPKDEYIQEVAFSKQISPEIKTNILSACVITNTIINARNLLHFAQLSKK